MEQAIERRVMGAGGGSTNRNEVVNRAGTPVDAAIERLAKQLQVLDGTASQFGERLTPVLLPGGGGGGAGSGEDKPLTCPLVDRLAEFEMRAAHIEGYLRQLLGRLQV